MPINNGGLVRQKSKSGERLLPARSRGSRQEAEHDLGIFLEVGLMCGFPAIAVVHFAGMTAQLFDRGGAQTSVGEGVDEHVQQRNELGVVEGVVGVVTEPVIELDFSETQ